MQNNSGSLEIEQNRDVLYYMKDFNDKQSKE
jgi:hypothetical protein